MTSAMEQYRRGIGSSWSCIGAVSLRSTSGEVEDDGAWLPMAEGMWGQGDGGLGQERKEMAAAGGGAVI